MQLNTNILFLIALISMLSTIDAEVRFEFSMLTEMDQEAIEEWQDENESFAFGVSVSVVSEDGEKEINIEIFDDFRTTLV